MADRWYLKGIHVPVNRFGSEENIKNGNRLQTGRHVSPTDILFHRQVKKSKVETSKDTLISLKQR
ncbi:hypothetical protein NXW27_23880 [Phocaeicola dorei]|nr:hypothetical protein [Phocaeicola dorei]